MQRPGERLHPSERGLRFVSIIQVIVGVVLLAFAVFLFVQAFLQGGLFVDINNFWYDENMGYGVGLGIVGAIGSIFSIVVGVMGIRASTQPMHSTAYLVTGCIGMLATVVWIVLAAVWMDYAQLTAAIINIIVQFICYLFGITVWRRGRWDKRAEAEGQANAEALSGGLHRGHGHPDRHHHEGHHTPRHAKKQ